MAKLVCGRWSKWIVLALWLGVLAVAGPHEEHARP